jgi:superfamily II DNA/RNA helicase
VSKKNSSYSSINCSLAVILNINNLVISVHIALKLTVKLFFYFYVLINSHFKQDIYSVSRSLEKLGVECAVIYGSLPPGTKLAMAERFNDPRDPCKVKATYI